MAEHTHDENENRIGCTPETLLQIKEERLRHAENQADVNMGAYLELKQHVAKMLETRDERIAELEKQLAAIEPPE